MSGIDETMAACNDDDEASAAREHAAELELERCSRQIQYEAERRRAKMRHPASRIPPLKVTDN